MPPTRARQDQTISCDELKSAANEQLRWGVVVFMCHNWSSLWKLNTFLVKIKLHYMNFITW